MKSSASLEINTLDWHFARCAEGNCSREVAKGEMHAKVVERCMINTCPIGHSNIEQDVLMHVLANTCSRNPRRL